MKRLLVLILLLFATSVYAGDMQLARTNPYVAGSVAAASSCTDISQSELVTSIVDDNFGLYTSIAFKYASRFQAGASDTICAVDFWLKKVGSPTGAVTAYIYADDGGGTPHPTGDPLASSDGTYNAASLSTDYGWVKFSFTVPYAMTATNYYWIAIGTTYTAPENTNYCAVAADADGTVERIDRYDASWGNDSTTRTLVYRLYK